jgi:anti-sigma regulatory factor (Ser/Thr protein kinase)
MNTKENDKSIIINAVDRSLDILEYLYNAKPNSLIVSLTDWGIPFDPLAKEDPVAPSSAAEAKIGGLGILMVKRLADDVSYLRDGDANVIAFRKNW